MDTRFRATEPGAYARPRRAVKDRRTTARYDVRPSSKGSQEESMSSSRRLLATLACVVTSSLALALHAQTRGDEVWITIERSLAQGAIAAFDSAGREGALAIEGEGKVALGRLSEKDIPMLAEWIHGER